ncbi:MAG: sulfite exporter TauE/SafE family protein [Patescibacteria group bacterium]
MEILLISLLIFFASTVTSVAGFGISSIIVSVLLLFYSFPAVLSLAVIIRWFDDVWKLIAYKTRPNWKLILTLGIPIVLAGFIGSRLAINIPEEVLIRTLGFLLLIYLGVVVSTNGLKIFKNKIVTAVASFFVGFVGGIFGTEGPFRAALLTNFNLDKKSFIFTSIAIAFLLDTVRFIGYFLEGAVIGDLFLEGLPFFLLASFLGTFVGKRILATLPRQKFRYLIATILAIVAINFIIFP